MVLPQKIHVSAYCRGMQGEHVIRSELHHTIGNNVKTKTVPLGVK